eukprot:TRINITY_DN2202_c0_g1_i1.p1 TRINITY_DN2202_c0_g1~~TRINITY_DN2202_c0_g1_i1.p1  ORF type:complete len:113 (+),score=17.45 TRINITY_DN2202_c0_g1_i1:260-598(+)
MSSSSSGSVSNHLKKLASSSCALFLPSLSSTPFCASCEGSFHFNLVPSTVTPPSSENLYTFLSSKFSKNGFSRNVKVMAKPDFKSLKSSTSTDFRNFSASWSDSVMKSDRSG